MTPLNGLYMAIMMNIAPETAIAQTTRVTNTVSLRGAKSPKLMKIAVSQATTTTSSGRERELPSEPRNINQYVRRRPMAAEIAAAFTATCASFFGWSNCNWL